MILVVSIPVHEKPDVIKNQISNFQKYIPGVVIVLHVSKGFLAKHRLDEIGEHSNVYINPEHLDTQWADIIQTHISNYRYIRENLEFDYFVLHASNDMYIRYGFEKYVQQYEAGFNIRKVVQKNSHWWPGNFALKDKKLKSIMDICGQNMIIASQVESSFYSKALMERIYTIIEPFCSERSADLIYPREEIYFSTVASSTVSWDKIGFTTTFSEVHRFDRRLWKIKNIMRTIFWRWKLSFFVSEKVYFRIEELCNTLLFNMRFYKTTIGIIKKLLDQNEAYIKKNSFLNDGSGQFQLYNKDIFSVKRINRDIKDPVRRYITNLP